MSLPVFFQLLKDNFRQHKYELVPYLVNDGKKHPFAIICPGGAYRVCASYVEGEPFAKELNKQGYHAFVLYYRTLNHAKYPNPQNDLKRAVREVLDHKDEWKIDTRFWSLWGSSAGGHLVASYCLDHDDLPLPSGLVLIYPVITMGEHTHKESSQHLLGKNPSQEMIDKLSIELNVTKDFPPTYIWNGTADKCVKPINSDLMEEALKNAGVKYKREVFQGVPHGVGLGNNTKAEGWFDRAIKFLEKNK